MRQKFYWLDTLRFLAAFVVVVSHSFQQFQTNFAGLAAEYHGTAYALLYLLMRCGGEAVLVFFVLSGFLVGGRTMEKLRGGTFAPRQYAVDRTVRIVLPLLPALVLSFVTNTLIGEHYHWYEYLGNLLSLQNYLVRPVSGPLWSLSSEVWFYILMFGAALFVMKDKILHVSLFGKRKILDSRIMGGAILALSSFIFLGLGFNGLLTWLAGAILYCLRGKIVSRKLTWLILALLPVAELYYKQTWWKGGLLLPWLPTPSAGFIHVVYAILIGYMLCWLTHQIPRGAWMVKIDKAGSSLAKFSYTLYLCHNSILLLIKQYVYPVVTDRMDLRCVTVLVCISVAATCLCYPLYLLSEKHTYRVKSFVKQRLIK